MSYVRTYGMGDAAATAHNVAIAGSLTGSALTATLAALQIGTNLIPIVGPAIAGITMGIQALIANSGCGPTCVITSQWAEQAAAQLQQLKDAYFALPAPRTNAQKAIVLANMQDVYNALKANCSQPGTGDAGKRCISDRQAGACTWRQKYSPTYPGDPEIGECWNWDNGYFEAIRRDVTVPDSSVSGSLNSVFSAAPGSVSWLPIAAVLGLVALGASL